MYSLHHHRRCWPPFIQYLPSITKFQLNVGPASQPIAGSMPVNRLRRWPNTNPSHGSCCILCAKTWHSPNDVLMFQCLQRWPVIETALGDCTVFSECCILLVTLSIPEPEILDNTIHWPNANVMLGHRPRRWADIILTKTL